MTPEQRRKEVNRLLWFCCDQKLLSCETEQALRLAENALNLAENPEPLPAPWPQLARYRKAHLLLRTARSYEALLEIEQLLSRAGDERAPPEKQPLGPLPLLYRLAVLNRLRALEPSESLHEQFQERIDGVFQAACRCLERQCHEHRARTAGLESPGPLQQGWFNMLELAAYFLGADYRPLEGWGRLDVMDYAPGDAWLLVSQDPLSAAVRMNRVLADAELKDRATRHPEAVLFRLTPDGSECRSALDEESAWRPVTEPGLHVLAGLMMGKFRTRRELLRHVAVMNHENGTDPSVQANRLRQMMNDVRKSLRELLGRPVEVLRSRPVRDNLPQVSDEILFFGLVHEETFREGPSRGR